MPCMHSTATYPFIFRAGLPRNPRVHHRAFLRYFEGLFSHRACVQRQCQHVFQWSSVGALKKTGYRMLSKTTGAASPAAYNRYPSPPKSSSNPKSEQPSCRRFTSIPHPLPSAIRAQAHAILILKMTPCRGYRLSAHR